MTPSTALAYAAYKTVVRHPVETFEAVKTVTIAAAPVVLPVAAAVGIGYGIYKLVTK